MNENPELSLIEETLVEKESSFKLGLSENAYWLIVISECDLGLNETVSNDEQFANEYGGISVIPLRATLFNDSQFWKTDDPIDVKLFGKSMDLREEQPKNALLWITSNFEGNFTLESNAQPEKTEISIISKLSGNSIDVSKEQPENAELPSVSILFGNVIDVSDEHW